MTPFRTPVIFEDEALIVFNKPEGVLSHPNPNGKGRSILKGRYHVGERRFDTLEGPLWLIHRLDQDTSGLLILAKTAKDAAACRAAFRLESLKKVYLALVVGQLRRETGTWKDRLEKQHGHGRVRSIIRPGPPNAELSYAAEKFLVAEREIPPMTLLKIKLITGKTHQIRVQAASRGHPLAGDRIYGDFELNRRLKKGRGLKRLFLHAYRLEFPHPRTTRKIELEAPLPEELARCLNRENQGREPRETVQFQKCSKNL